MLGGGYTACELGQFLAAWAPSTTMLIRSGHLLTAARRRHRRCADAVFSRRRHRRRRPRDAACGAHRARRQESRTVLEQTAPNARSPRTKSSTRSGACPNVAGLDLESADVAYDPIRRHRRSISTLRTTNPNIFAVGDVTGDFHARPRRDLPRRDRGAQLVHERARRSRLPDRHGAHGFQRSASRRRRRRPRKNCSATASPYVVGDYDFAEHGKAHMPQQRPKAS